MRVQGVENIFIHMRQDVNNREIFQERQGVDLPKTKTEYVDKTEVKANTKQEQQKLDDALKSAVGQANKTMETYGTELRFDIHKASGEMIVKVINTKDNSVIREIPPERILDMVAHVKKMLGIIIDKFI